MSNSLKTYNLAIGKVDVHYATRGLQGWPKLWVQVRFMMMMTINMIKMIIVIKIILMIINPIKGILMTNGH